MVEAARRRMGDVLVRDLVRIRFNWRESCLDVLVSDDCKMWKASTVVLQTVKCGPKLETRPRRFAKVHRIDS